MENQMHEELVGTIKVNDKTTNKRKRQKMGYNVFMQQFILKYNRFKL